jgi:hypothetical protein
MTHTRNRE